MAYTLTTALSTGTAGQTLSAQLVDTTGANVGSAVTAGFIDLSAGFYEWTYAAFPDGFRGVVKFSVSGTVKTVAVINPQEGENLDVKTSTRATAVSTSIAVAYVGPVAPSGDVTIIRGNDYNHADRAVPEWLTSDAATWPDLTSATVVLTVKNASGSSTMTKAGTVVVATGVAKQVRFEPTAADTDALIPTEQHHFDVVATLSSGRTVTLMRGNAFVLPNYTPSP